MQYLNKLIVLIALTSFSCVMTMQGNDNEVKQIIKKLKGDWVNESDSEWRLSFMGNKVLETYGIENIGEYSFYLSKSSCDTTYLDASEKGLFIRYENEDNSCFEITSLTNTTFAYRETSTGKLYIFNRSE